jgi:hypothetical protein
LTEQVDFLHRRSLGVGLLSLSPIWVCKVAGPPSVTPSYVPRGPDGRWVRRPQLEMARPRNRGREWSVGCRHQCVKHKIHIVSETRTLCMPIASLVQYFFAWTVMCRLISCPAAVPARVIGPSTPCRPPVFKACSCQYPARHRCHPCGCRRKPSLQAQQTPTLTGATSDI